MYRRRRQHHTDPFTDLLFNALLGFTFLFMVAFVLVNPISKLGEVNLKAEYIITLTWPSSQPDDIDLWVRDPLGQVVSYLQRDVGWLHLDRDDRGDANDVVIVDGETKVNPLNQEVVTLRGVVAGEYTVNVYYYESQTQSPVTVTVQVDKVNPVLKVLYAEQIELERKLDEVTAIRFTLDEAGDLRSLSKLPRTLTPYLLEPNSRQAPQGTAMLFTTVADDAGLGIAALALTSTVLLLLTLVNASISRAWKIASVLVAFAALTLAWKSMIDVLGFPTAAALPADYQVLSTQVKEPELSDGEAGAVFLWVRNVDGGVMPRAFAVPYTTDLHRTITSLESGQGRHQRMYGRGDDAGGVELYLHAQRPPPKRQSRP